MSVYFKELLGRANLNNIESFLRTGAGTVAEPPEGTYFERIRAAEEKMAEFLKENFPELRENDRASDLIYDVVEVYQDVYYEIGLFMGAKIAMQIKEKMESLR